MNNYARGRRFEYRAKCFLEKQGFIVFRTAGSHSPEVGIMSIASEPKRAMKLELVG